MPAEKSNKKGFIEKQKTNQAQGSQRAMLEDLFNDLYIDRGRVYKMNLVRGIAFGLGSAIGGTIGVTILLALVVWILNLFGGFPLIGEWLSGFSDDISQQ